MVECTSFNHLTGVKNADCVILDFLNLIDETPVIIIPPLDIHVHEKYQKQEEEKERLNVLERNK